MITHASTQAARFLGYEIAAHHCDTKQRHQRRSINGQMALLIPAPVVEAQCRRYQRAGKAIHRPELLNESDHTIVSLYQLEYRGCVQYYQLAENLAQLTRLHWVMERSLLKTLACKHQATTGAVVKKYGSKVETPDGLRKCLKVVHPREGKGPLIAIFGGIPLRRNRRAALKDQPAKRLLSKRSELLQRLLAEECEVCNSREKVEVHHIRKLSDVQKPGRRPRPYWVEVMASRKRKTMVLCKKCHDDLHAGRLNAPKAKE